LRAFELAGLALAMASTSGSSSGRSCPPPGRPRRRGCAGRGEQLAGVAAGAGVALQDQAEGPALQQGLEGLGRVLDDADLGPDPGPLPPRGLLQACSPLRSRRRGSGRVAGRPRPEGPGRLEVPGRSRDRGVEAEDLGHDEVGRGRKPWRAASPPRVQGQGQGPPHPQVTEGVVDTARQLRAEVEGDVVDGEPPGLDEVVPVRGRCRIRAASARRRNSTRCGRSDRVCSRVAPSGRSVKTTRRKGGWLRR